MGGINNTMEKLKFMKDFNYKHLDDYKKSMETLGINKADFKNFILVIINKKFILVQTMEVYSDIRNCKEKHTVIEISSSDWIEFKSMIEEHFNIRG